MAISIANAWFKVERNIITIKKETDQIIQKARKSIVKYCKFI